MDYGIDGRYIQDHFPGIGRYTYFLIDALARVAPDDRLVVWHNPALRNTRYDIGALGRHPNVHLVQSDIATFSIREQYALVRRDPAAGAYPRLFHSPYYIKPYWTRLPSIVTIFDLLPMFYPQALPNARTRILFRWMVTLAARTARHILVPSTSTCNDLVAHLGIPRHKITVTPLAADARFAPQSAGETDRVRGKYGLTQDYVLYVGINKPHKNLATLLEAWKKLADPARLLVIAGAWDERYARVQRSAEQGRGAVHFIPNIADADLAGLYTGATVFVTPSLYEGFGLPALEAMACGTPVVVSNTSSLPQVVGDAAILFDPHDPHALAACLAELLGDRARREMMRERSLVRAGQFSWERTARETLTVYRAV